MNPKFSYKAAVYTAVITIIILLVACGQGSKRVPTILGVGTQQAAEPLAMEQQVTWPGTLPEDRAQPWEELDANGHVMPPKGAEGPEQGRRASNLNFDSIFAAGIERYLEAGDVTNYGEASSFSSGAPGGEAVSYAIYRLPLGVEQPGTIAADVNLHNGSSYYIGVGDYSVNTWHWYGPFDVSHVRFNVPDAEYASGIGNLMLAVVAYDGASFDVVALGANVRDAADTEAPPIPAAPTLTSVTGGVFAEWNNVAAGDLAGYRIYADGEQVLDYLEGGTSLVIPCAEEVEVTLTAVDISGNESELSDPATETPLAGEMPSVELSATAASGVRNDVIELAATGAETYDWDVDGDGVWDYTDDPTGTRDADTGNLGVIRPAIRAHTSEGGFSLSAVSLFITGNFRPVVLATADVTYGTAPLDVNFTIIAEDDDGTIELWAWDFDGDGTFDDFSPTDPSPLPHTYSIPGLYNAKFRATDNDGAWAVDTVSISALNLAPVASLTVAPDEVILGLGDTPPDVTLDGSGSTDPDGGPLEFAFDFYGNNSFTSYQSDPTYMDFYPNAGRYGPTLRVRNAGGLVSEISRSVNMYKFSSMVIDDTYSVGEYSSIIDLDGFPGVFYHDSDLGYLKFVRAGYGDGSYWNEPEIVDGRKVDVGRYASAAVVNGHPAIAYFDTTGRDLKYVRAENATGTSWGTPRILDYEGYVGALPSLAVINGNPAICYYDSDNSNLKFVRANDADGTSWGTPITIDSKYGTGNHNSLMVVNGNPAIAYNNWNDSDLRYIRATDANGAGWGSPIVVDSAYEGRYISLAAVNGNPAISYYGSGGGDLRYVRATNADGSAWGIPTTIDSTGLTGWHTSMKVVDGKPAISYQYYSTYDLYYIRANDADGATWPAPVVVETMDAVGYYTSLHVVNGNPAISYYDETNDDLKYVRATNVEGSTWGAPVTVYSTESVGKYTSMAIADGNPVIAYFDSTEERLRFARSSDASGTSWNNYVADSGDCNVGSFASGLMVGGYPAAAYFDDTHYDLRFCRALDETGESWGRPVLLDIEGEVGEYASAAVVASNPAVAYQDLDNEVLKYVRAVDQNGASWGSPIVVDDGGGDSVGEFSSLVVVNGRPAISYYQCDDYDLLYVRATDSTGASWGTPITVVSDGDVGYYSSMAIIDGRPAIAYYDYDIEDLEFIRANDSDGSTWGTPVVVVDGVGVDSIVRMTERNGLPVIIYTDDDEEDLLYVSAIDPSGTSWGEPKRVDVNGDVGEYASVIISGAGLPLIAYYDGDNRHLKFATLRLY